MTMLAIDPEYARLLGRVQPRVPRNRAENERLLGEIRKIMKKGEGNIKPAESALLNG